MLPVPVHSDSVELTIEDSMVGKIHVIISVHPMCIPCRHPRYS